MSANDQTLEPSFRHLVSGIDTLEICFHLAPLPGCLLDFEGLLTKREALRTAKKRQPDEVRIGSESFLLAPNGSSSGYPLLLSNDWAVISYGQRNLPPFHVKFLSQALWSHGWEGLAQRFLSWALGAGFEPYAPEKISRVDFCFDYCIPERDFGDENFVTLSAKEATYRERRVDQTFDFGRGDAKLRVYDKVAEIKQKSGKTFFFDIWGVCESVWRIEWQLRKALLKRFGIRTFQGLRDQSGDLLTYMSTEHDTLRVVTGDSNRSRWPLHPLWRDVQARAAVYGRQGLLAEIDPGASIAERLRRCAISMYGYTKAIGALEAVKSGQESVAFDYALEAVRKLIKDSHNPIVWEHDVAKKASRLRLGAK